MRALAIALAVALAGCSNAPQTVVPTPSPTHEPNVLKVSVLLDLSGPRAPSGNPQKDAMQLWLDQAAAARPAARVQVRVKFVDVAGSDAKALIELRRAVVEDHADAIVIGAAMPLDETLTRAAQAAGAPVLVTLPMADPAPLDGGRWVFALAPAPLAVLRAVTVDMIDRGPPVPVLLVTDESRAASVERTALFTMLDRLQLVRPTALVLRSEQLGRIRAGAAVARTVVLLGPAAPYGDAVRAIPLGAAGPRVYLSWLTETADVTNLRESSALVSWPGSRNLAGSGPPRAGLRTVFSGSFADRHGAPSTLAATAYDALVLLDAAAASTPSPFPAERLRFALESQIVDGAASRYRFSGGSHSGFSEADIAILRWDQRGFPVLAPTPPPAAPMPQ